MGKNRFAIGVILLGLGLLTLLLPHFILPVCEVHEGASPMKCHWSALAELGAGAVVIIGALAIIFSRKALFRAGVAFAVAIMGLLIAAIPSKLIGVCSSPMMPCHAGTMPALVITGGLIFVTALIYSIKVYKSA